MSKEKARSERTPLLRVDGLETTFRSETGEHTYLDDISFSIMPGEFVGLVGESGSGKSITSLSIMGLLNKYGRVTAGEVCFEGRDLLKLSPEELDAIRGDELTMIFQDAQTSLNPAFTVAFQIRESLMVHQGLSRKDADRRVLELLDKVGLPEPEQVARSYPHTLSGGMRQRVMIAMALAGRPKLLIADEPTTALDVTIQAQIIQLLEDLQAELGTAILLITHDLGVIAQSADRVIVMYAGQIVETAEVYDLFDRPLHPYTRALMRAIPALKDDPDLRLQPIDGSVPEHYDTIEGCRFASRCRYAVPACSEHYQPLQSPAEGRFLRCQRVMDASLPWMRDVDGDGKPDPEGVPPVDKEKGPMPDTRRDEALADESAEAAKQITNPGAEEPKTETPKADKPEAEAPQAKTPEAPTNGRAPSEPDAESTTAYPDEGGPA